MCPHQGNVGDMIDQEKQKKKASPKRIHLKEIIVLASMHSMVHGFLFYFLSFKFTFNCFGYYMPIFGTLVICAILCIVIPISCAFLVTIFLFGRLLAT